MPPIGEAPPVYTSIPQSAAPPRPAPNVVDVKRGGLEDVVKSFASATGNPDAALRTLGDSADMQVVVPASKSSPSSLWTRFKAALSNLGPFKLSASLRAARLERDSRPQNDALLADIVSVVEREEQKFKRDFDVDLQGKYTESVRKNLAQKPLTKRNVTQVLNGALSVMSSYGAELHMQRATAQMRGTARPAPRKPPALTGRSEPLTRAKVLELEATQVHPASKDAPVMPRSRSASGRHKGLTDLCTRAVAAKMGTADRHVIDAEVRKLYDEVRSFLIRRGKWPITDFEHAVAAVEYLNR